MKLPFFLCEQLIENSIDSIVVTDMEHQILYANKAAEDMFGYSKAEMHNKNISIFSIPAKENITEILGSVYRKDKWSGEMLLARKDNTTFKAALSVFTVDDEPGHTVGYVINSKDISETARAQESLLAKQMQLVSIIDNTVDVIASIDNNLKLVEFNKVLADMVMLGFKHKLEKGDYMLDYIDPKKHEHLKDIYKKVFTGERLSDIEIFESSKKDFIYFESSYNPIVNEAGVVTGISIFSKNITERVRSEQALKKALAEKDILLSEIHHRLKNNLAIISSILHLQELNISNAEALRALNESRMRIKSTALLHEMLYQNESIDKLEVKQYLNKLFNDINGSLGNNLYKLNIEGDDAYLLPHNAVHAGLLFNELFTNSFKHGFGGNGEGEILIKMKNDAGKRILFDIAESGGRFPKDVDFETAVSTGMTLIKTFVEQLNGDIELIKEPNTRYLISIDLS